MTLGRFFKIVRLHLVVFTKLLLVLNQV